MSVFVDIVPDESQADSPAERPSKGTHRADEIRRSPEYTRLRAEVGRAVKAAAA